VAGLQRYLSTAAQTGGPRLRREEVALVRARDTCDNRCSATTGAFHLGPFKTDAGQRDLPLLHLAGVHSLTIRNRGNGTR
jgi:hypothetical protein